MARHAKKARKTSEFMLSRIREVLSEEQTILSRERTTHSYMQTGIAFISVGIVIINYFSRELGYVMLGGVLVFIGLMEIGESLKRLSKQKGLMKQVKQKEKKYRIFE